MMETGDLVVLDQQSHFVEGIRDIIGIPFNEVGIVIAVKCGVCSVIFPSVGNKLRSFMREDLKIISEVKDERE
tara:strand:+ start:230 stop:448 length:219 start_codon:yes stop_codon:yes gene_type:complete